jgi:hypothetical protein
MPDHCQECRYRLDGLPESHRCPECGLPYFKRSEIIKQNRGGPIACAIVGMISLFVLWGETVPTSTPVIWAAFTSAVFLYLSVRLVLWGLRCLCRRNRAILSRFGLVIIGRIATTGVGDSDEPWFATWGEIGEIGSSKFGGSIIIRGRSGEVMLKLDSEFFGFRYLGDKFIRRANDWREVYNYIANIRDEAGVDHQPSQMPDS